MPTSTTACWRATPAFSLPKAATAQLWKAQQYAKVATKDASTGQPDLTKAVSPAEFQLIGRKIVEQAATHWTAPPTAR